MATKLWPITYLLHTHTLSLSLSHTHTLSLSLSHTHTLSLSLTHTHTHSHSLSHTHTHTLTLSSHTHTLSHSLTLFLSHTHTHTHTHSKEARSSQFILQCGTVSKLAQYMMWMIIIIWLFVFAAVNDYVSTLHSIYQHYDIFSGIKYKLISSNGIYTTSIHQLTSCEKLCL